jgi:hypothetical protein
MDGKGKRMNRKLTWQILLLAWLAGSAGGIAVSQLLFHQTFFQGFLHVTPIATLTVAVFKFAEGASSRKKS